MSKENFAAQINAPMEPPLDFDLGDLSDISDALTHKTLADFEDKSPLQKGTKLQPEESVVAEEDPITVHKEQEASPVPANSELPSNEEAHIEGDIPVEDVDLPDNPTEANTEILDVETSRNNTDEEESPDIPEDEPEDEPEEEPEDEPGDVSDEDSSDVSEDEPEDEPEDIEDEPEDIENDSEHFEALVNHLKGFGLFKLNKTEIVDEKEQTVNVYIGDVSAIQSMGDEDFISKFLSETGVKSMDIFDDASYFVVVQGEETPRTFTADTSEELLTVLSETGVAVDLKSQIDSYIDEEVSLEDSLLIVDQYI